MARVNIEDDISKDRRFQKLLVKLGGDPDRAYGALVRAWMLAQKWFLTPERMIPLAEWKKQEINDAIIDVGLAKVKDEKIWICGAKEQFGWLLKCQEAGAKGGVKNKGKSRKGTQRVQKGIEGSSSSSSSSSKEKDRESAVALPRLAGVWNTYCGDLPRVKGCSSSRRKKAEARWREVPDEAHWIAVIKRIAASEFCRGQNERGWRADFDFLVAPETQHKVLEGKYDDRQRPKINTKPIELGDIA